MHYYQIMYRKLHILHTMLGCKERFEINFLEVKVMLWKKISSSKVHTIHITALMGYPSYGSPHLGQPGKQFKTHTSIKDTLMPLYHCHKPVFRPKMAIFWRVGMREGGLPLPLAFQYLILMI